MRPNKLVGFSPGRPLSGLHSEHPPRLKKIKRRSPATRTLSQLVNTAAFISTYPEVERDERL
jgi:hypothetical protein